MILTNAGYFGAVPPETQEGDLCVCVAPLLDSLIIRPLAPDQTPSFDPNDEIGRWASDLFLAVEWDEGRERQPIRPTTDNIPIWPAADDIEEGDPFIHTSRDVTCTHTVEEGVAIPGDLPGGLSMRSAHSGRVKRRKNPVRDTDILHCKVVGKCRIYGFQLWNTDDDPSSRDAQTTISNLPAKVFVMH